MSKRKQKQRLKKLLDEISTDLSSLGTRLDEAHFLLSGQDKREVWSIRLDCCGHSSALARISMLL